MHIFAVQVVVLLLMLGPACCAAQTLSTASSAEVHWYDRLADAFSEEAFQRGERNLKIWLRDQFVSEDDLATYGLSLAPDWQSAPESQPLVVLVHGYNSTPDKTTQLFAPIVDAGYPCATFSYPNDHALAESAERLSYDLRAFARAHPERRLALVCHSMGSLVARACIEDAALDPGNVDRLIMVAPPTHGSMLATISVGTDIWEHWLARSDGWPWTRLHDSIVDGLGEASGDLCPGSEFLTRLNERKRNARTHYTILLGTVGVMTAEEMQSLRQSTRKTLEWIPGTDQSAERLDAFLGDFNEIVHGRGDGVVAVERGRLKGVSDTVLLPFGHLKVTDAPESEEIRQVHRAVLERIN